MKKILIIDEDLDWLLAMECCFERQGYDAASVTSYQEGLLALTFFNPDFIFIDIKPENLDGPLLCKKIKERAQYRHIPVVFISSHKEALKSYKDYGAITFLKKPFQLSMLLTVLETHL